MFSWQNQREKLYWFPFVLTSFTPQICHCISKTASELHTCSIMSKKNCPESSLLNDWLWTDKTEITQVCFNIFRERTWHNSAAPKPVLTLPHSSTPNDRYLILAWSLCLDRVFSLGGCKPIQCIIKSLNCVPAQPWATGAAGSKDRAVHV